MRTASKSALLVLALAASGCSSHPARINEIEVPIPVRCKVAYPVKPASCFEALPANAPVFESVKCLLVDRENSLAYEGELLAALKACAEPL